MSKYKPYPKYKDSGVEWLGQVPEGWKIIALKSVVAMKSGEQITSTDIASEGDYPVYGGNGLRGYTNRYTHDGHYPLIGRQGALCGNVQYAQGKFWASEHAIVVNPVSPCSIFWLGELLRAMNLGQYSVSAAQPGLAVESIGNLRVPVPPLSEQQAIAAFLDQETACIDTVISKQQRLIELLQEKRQALISHVVTKGLNPDEPMKDSGVEWIGQLPKSWVRTKLIHVTSRIQTGPFGSQLHADEYIMSGVPVINPAHIQDGELTPDSSCSVSDDVRERLSQHKLKPGEIIFARRGEMGRCAVVPEQAENWLCGTGCLRLSLSPNLVLPKFAYFYLSTPAIKDYLELKSVGATLANLNTEILSNIPCVVPPLSEQRSIIAFLERELIKIDVLIAKAQRAIALAQERRSAIISAAVTGKICVTQQLTEEQELFWKLVLSAAIINQLYQEATFGRIKHQKIRHICEYDAQLPFQHSDYQRYPEGTLDPTVLYHQIEPQLKERKWFEARERDEGKKIDYIPMENHQEYQSYYADIFKEKHHAIQKVIDLLRDKDTNFCGMVSTLYGGWNDLLLNGERPTDEEIVHDVLTHWDDKKQSIPKHRWLDKLQWMRENGLIPCGWGKPIRQRRQS